MKLLYGLMYKNRITIMYALDMLVINNIHILSIKKKMYENKVNGYTMSAIYGSVLPVIYSLILNEIGYYLHLLVNIKNH